MAELLNVLSVGGDVGIYLLLYVAWRSNERITEISFGLKEHTALDTAEFKRINHRGAVMDEQRPLGLESLAKRSGDRTPRGIFSVVSQRGFERC